MKLRPRRKYKLDGDFTMKEKGLSLLDVTEMVMKFLLITVSLTLVYYGVFSLIIDTDVEKRLKEENRAYDSRQLYQIVSYTN